MTCNNQKTAVVIFAYNRPRHLELLYKNINNFQVNAEFCFHLFHDGPKDTFTFQIQESVKLSREFIKVLENYEIRINKQNLGLAKSIRQGLNAVFTNHGQAIILEDDIIPNKEFFKMVQFFLETQKNNQSIGSITGANTTKFPIWVKKNFLLSSRHSSWGWATWADRWNNIDWNYVENHFLQDPNQLKKVNSVSPDLVRYSRLQKENKIDSWATAMNIDFIKKGLLCVVPKKNFIQNIGFDGSGTHTGKTSRLASRQTAFTVAPSIQYEKVLLTQNAIYDFLVRKDNSLMRDFPKGTFVRVGLSLRDAIFKLMN